ncbi:chloride channel protein [Leptolyngbya sp. FACHB-261]|nr:chloride channel protein [Leptolyngbya sp. FACHB-261]
MWHLPVPNRLWQLLQPKRLAIFEACVIGLVSGLAGFLLKQQVGWLGGWRVYAAHVLPPWLILPAIGLCGGLLAGWLVERLAPEAAGSGIPQVKSALARLPVSLDLRVAVVKLVSTTLVLGSGLTLGRQGPTVQIGAALAAQLSRWVPTSPDYRRQLIAAGTAAGLAAGFNAPIAGVLFVIEELLQDVSGLTLGTAILASFVGAVVSRLLGGNELSVGMNADQINFLPQEIPLLLILGVLAGLLGGLFCQGVFLSLTFYRRVLRLGLPWRVGLAGLASGLIVALLPASFRDNAGMQELLVTGEASWQVTAVALVIRFGLTLIACGSGAPGGLFAPSLVMGSALGYLVGTGAQSLQNLSLVSGVSWGADLVGSPTVYALAGMGAVFSAVARGPITAIVIVFEMTTNFNLVLPLMITSVVAYLVSEQVFPGSLYTRLLEWNGIKLDSDAPADGLWAKLTAEDIMQGRVETLASELSLDEVVQAFSRSHHRGFPVLDEGKLVGIVTQTDLAVINQRGLAGDLPLREIMTLQPVTVRPSDPLTQVLYLLDRYKLSRLPVTEGRKLVGIITRADIIRVESDRLSGDHNRFGPQPEPSYVVHQTRAPALGQGRLLVPLANPQTASALLRLAAAIARERHFELECLQVILVPRDNSPSETSVRTTSSRRLLDRAVRLGKELKIPVHTQVRVAHDVAQAILETLKERHIDLVLMGWEGSTPTPGRIFGNVVDTVIRQAACEVVLVKLCSQTIPNRWLVPMAGGPNAQQAVQLLPALVSLSSAPEIRLCQVFEPSQPRPDQSNLERAARFLSRRLSQRGHGRAVPWKVSTTPVHATSVSHAVLDLARQDQCDVIVLGASREGLLQQVIKGNIPEAIARNSKRTVILVRGAVGS